MLLTHLELQKFLAVPDLSAKHRSDISGWGFADVICEVLTADFQERVRKADLFTVTAGGTDDCQQLCH